MNNNVAEAQRPPDAETRHPQDRTVVAVVMEWRGRIALLKRSRRLDHDAGLWHCVSGFLEAGVTPEQQALEELFEETGTQAKDLLELRHGPALVLPDDRGTQWLVYTFTAVTTRRGLRLDWEHDSYRWTTADRAKRFSNRVGWLDTVLDATGHVAAVHPTEQLLLPA
ncbi:NUDIX domain-containing protein [Arthrobacter sp. K5]|uniref:NUDIX domain-containing protein n=1 Tax=Arthrobacter sp. K5 TaxID=2839623 RepID=A0AAU8EWI6_9MICC